MKMKKLTALLLSLLLALSCTVPAMAAQQNPITKINVIGLVLPKAGMSVRESVGNVKVVDQDGNWLEHNHGIWYKVVDADKVVGGNLVKMDSGEKFEAENQYLYALGIDEQLNRFNRDADGNVLFEVYFDGKTLENTRVVGGELGTNNMPAVNLRYTPKGYMDSDLEITSQPDDIVLLRNKSATVEIGGDDEYSYQWYYSRDKENWSKLGETEPGFSEGDANYPLKFSGAATQRMTVSAQEYTRFVTVYLKCIVTGNNGQQTESRIVSCTVAEKDPSAPMVTELHVRNFNPPEVGKTKANSMQNVKVYSQNGTQLDYDFYYSTGDTDDTWRTVSDTEVFKAGETYTLHITLNPKSINYNTDELGGALIAPYLGDTPWAEASVYGGHSVDGNVTLACKFTLEKGTPETVEPVAQIGFSDVSLDAWYYDSVEKAVSMGLVNGMTENTFAPDSNMTYAQAIKLAACMNQLYNEGKVTLKNGSPHWYDSYVSYCLEKKIIDQDYSDVINDKIDRQTYAGIFAKALPAEALPAKNDIPDNAIPDVKKGMTYYDAIYTLYRAGIINGSKSDGTFAPTSNIKRSEVATILVRMMDETTRVGKPADLK